VYREQGYVERCHCEAAAIAACGSCGRARCGLHLERGLCNRCAQAVSRALDARSTQRFVVSSVAGTGVTLAFLVAQLTVGIAIGIPLAVATFLGMRAAQRRRLIAQMGPALSASKGELPPPDRTPDEPASSWSPPQTPGSFV
jgi:hypothetical protein